MLLSIELISSMSYAEAVRLDGNDVIQCILTRSTVKMRPPLEESPIHLCATTPTIVENAITKGPE